MGPHIQVMDHEPLPHVAEVRHVVEDHADEEDRDGQNGGGGGLDVEAGEHESQAHEGDGFKGHEEMDDRKALPRCRAVKGANDLIQRQSHEQAAGRKEHTRHQREIGRASCRERV